MPVLTEDPNLGDLLKYEAPNLYSREQVTVAAGQTLPLGCVLGRQTVNRKLYALAPAASDGSEIAVGVLAQPVDARLIDRDDAVLIARHATLARSAVVWPEGISAEQKVLAIAQLETLGIVLRDSA